MAYYRRSQYSDNSRIAKTVRKFVFSHYHPKSSYHKSVGNNNYRKTKKSIRSGTFRGFSFRNGRNAPSL